MKSHHLEIWLGDWVGFYAISTQRYPDDFRTDKPIPPLALHKWYQMKLEVKRKTFVFWLNQQKILVHKDEAVKKGKVGLGAAGYTVKFDKIEISGPGVPDFDSTNLESAIYRRAKWAHHNMVYAETQALMCAISRIVVVVAYW